MSIIPEVQLRALTRHEANPAHDAQAVELLQASATRVFIAYHEIAVLPANGRWPAKQLDHYKVVACDFNKQFQAWGLNYKSAANIPWAMRDTFLRSMVVEAVRHGVLTSATLKGGEVLTAAKPAKAKAVRNGKLDDPPFDGGTVKAKTRKGRNATA